MSPERIYGVLFAALILVAINNVLALECYVCSSLENSSCSSDLEDIGTMTCGSSTTSSTTTADASTSTGSSMSTVSSTQAEESSQSSISTIESSTDSSITSDSTESGVITDTSESSATSFDTTTETSSSSDTEQSTTEYTDSTSESTSASDTSANTESDSITTDAPIISNRDELMYIDTIDNSLSKSDPDDRLLHNLVRRDTTGMLNHKNSEDYVCYMIVYTKNSTSVTERGCYFGTSSTACAALNEDISPDSWNECTTCQEDGCNSTSTIRLSVPSFLLLLGTVFVLAR